MGRLASRPRQAQRRGRARSARPRGEEDPKGERGSPWSFPSARKVAGGVRTTTIDETERRLVAVLPKVPVTRLTDLTPLDPLGLPIFAAVTPLARDLTVHSGKGLDSRSARVSALMEAVERVSAETIARERCRRASFRELVDRGDAAVVDPRHFDLPKNSAYRESKRFDWVRGHDLLSDSPVWLPVDLATSPPREGILRDVDTNGLASGNTLLEATVHALCEVIERDAASQLEFVTRFGRLGRSAPRVQRIDPEGLPPRARALADRIESHGIALSVHEVSTDLMVPTFRSVLMDGSFPGEGGLATWYFPGFGTHPDAEVALLRSITEAVQSRVGFIQGARDTYNSVDLALPGQALQRSWDLFPVETKPYSKKGSFRSRDLREDLRHLLARLTGRGFERAVVADLTSPDLGIPVVRVRVPGLACFLVNQHRIGWRCLRHLL
jgi:ribosomal protein S12 methylthiotransferase accessory factor